MPPFGSFVATQAKGERSTNCRVRSFRWSAIFATTTSAGEPISSRSSASSVIVRSVFTAQQGTFAGLRGVAHAIAGRA